MITWPGYHRSNMITWPCVWQVSDKLVDQAAEILKNIDREVVEGSFELAQFCAGVPFGGDEWLSNPQESKRNLRGI